MSTNNPAAKRNVDMVCTNNAYNGDWQMNASPTTETYHNFQQAYDHFNQTLFGGLLPNCLITLQRKDKRSYGYFSKGRFVDREQRSVDEIAMNPAFFHGADQRDIVSTLAHEMVHLWQHHFGKPSKSHHNKEWAECMKGIGLQPSTTGRPGGKETGQKCSHYMIDNGAYDIAWKDLIASGFKLVYSERQFDEAAKKKNTSNRVKYVCEYCAAAVWGKPELRITCSDCDAPYLACE